MATRLPHLEDVERLSPRVIRILGGNPSKFTLQGTNTYLVGTGRDRILIDSGQGIPSWKTHLAQTLATENCQITILLLTHWHPDHVGGLGDFQTLCPNAHIHKNQAVPSTDPNHADISDHQNFTVPGATLRALHTPGHTADHISFLLQEESALFTGDNVLGHGTAVFEDLAAYLTSLSKLRTSLPSPTPTTKAQAQAQARAYPGHGALIPNAPAKIDEYLSHRREREEQILNVLTEAGDEGLTSLDVVKVVYKGYPESLHGPAEGGVVLVLRKLEGEGRAREGEGGRWGVVGKGRAAL